MVLQEYRSCSRKGEEAVKKRIYILVLALLGMLYSNIAFAKPVAGHVVIVVDGQDKPIETGAIAFVDQYQIMLPVAVIKDYLYDNLSLDSDNKRVNFGLLLPKFRLETEHLDEFIYSGVDLNFSTKEISGQPYMNIYGLDKLLGINVTYHEISKNLIIQSGKNSFFSPLQLNKPRESQVFPGKINLVWDHVTKDSRNLEAESKITGLDVLAPTWFSIANEDGLVISKADMKYVQDAHTKGYKVWALVNNSFDRDLTRTILNNEWAKRNVIKQLLVYSSLYNLDGINIDFENVYDEDKGKLTEFVGELTAALKEQNIVVSIDVTIPSTTSYWSLCYDRSELGKIVDYVMVMTYDEHWRSSPVSGSVASQGWVDKGIAATLHSVPKEKLLMGIPFYTREWEETSENGRTIVKSRAISMAQANTIIAEQGLSPVWLQDKGQNYVEYHKAGKLYRIWLEDQKSIALKANLVHKYGLAGAASWRKDFEQPEIWDVLNATLKKSATHQLN
ncbi:putative glycosylase YvbX [Sporomusaceae bacterium FL31]|nr:putative glycosylase YvbX [Sporomusaceae bacterium FL31]GCE35240.1 putative glycosylase YvbX [Sporomusaceae bacterium]